MPWAASVATLEAAERTVVIAGADGGVHAHGLHVSTRGDSDVADRVFGGLHGAIVVEDDANAVPDARERVLAISDISFAGGGVAAGSDADRMMARDGALLPVDGHGRERGVTRDPAAEQLRRGVEDRV